MTDPNFIQPVALKNEIEKIWIHKNPDIDEIIAVWVAMTFGQRRFPGIDCAAIELVDPHLVSSDYKELLDKKILCIGFGGGPFDEHPEQGDNGSRINGESAASLVARALGVRYSAGVKEIIEYAIDKDHNANSREFELAPLIKAAFRFNLKLEQDQEERDNKVFDIMNAAFVLLEGYWRQAKAFEDCKTEFENTKHEATITKPAGKVLKLVSVQSPNPEMSKFCRSKEGGFAHVIVQRQKSGHTQIYFDYKTVEHDLTAWVIHDLRIAERRANGYFNPLSCQELMADGAIDGAEAWYYEYDKRLILNGSLTHSRTPTKLTLEQIELIVLNAVERYYQFVKDQNPTEA